jgi:hypothetical protein
VCSSDLSEIWGWGDGYAFITASVGAVTTPTRVGTGTGFTQVSIGNEHALALGPGGVVYAWGLRSNGALGDGTTGGAPVSSPGVVFH